MPRLTVKQKFAAVFSLYLFIFLVFFCVIFFVIYQFLIRQQITAVVDQSSQQVLDHYLTVDNGQLKLKLDSQGKTLKEYFLSESVSAIIFNSEQSVFKSYGVFALMDSESKNWPKFMDLVRKNSFLKNNQPLDFPLALGQVTMLVTPIWNKDQIVGTLVVGKSWEEYNQAKNTIILVTVSLGILGLGGSFLLGYILANHAFKPVGKMIKAIEETDIETLHKTIHVNGNPADELVYLARKINEMFSRLRVCAQQQKDFLSHASHELKRPMVKAVSALDVIALKRDTSVDKIIRVRDDLLEVSVLLDDLLSLSPLEKNIPYGSSNLKKIIDDIVTKFEPEITNKNLKVEKAVDPNIDVNIPQSYLLIVISNLFSNAIKYSYPQGSIKITTKQEQPPFLEIEDQGIGLSSEEIKKVFQRCFRSEGAKKTNLGNGLGLTIVKQICEIYKIEISLSSEVGKGTKVLLMFH